MFPHTQLRLECFEPAVVEFSFAALDELPCAGVVRAFLDGEVYVADGYVVFDFVVEDCLEGGDDLYSCTLAVSFEVVEEEEKDEGISSQERQIRHRRLVILRYTGREREPKPVAASGKNKCRRVEREVYIHKHHQYRKAAPSEVSVDPLRI